ncbi:MAG: type II secretion system minor pseudopilin GspJ [Gammaproteobacteria bacterium]|nr:type II secretion system minor pseudopilin GspJ [Gammaproteobacteria bacterium]
MNRVSQQAFTLIELLVAIAVFSVLAVAAYSGLSSVLQTRSITAERSDQLNALQQTFYYFSDDLQQMIDRPIRDELGSQQASFITNQGDSLILAFSRSGWQNPLGSPRSQLQRVSYLLEDDTLYRQYWQHLDRIQGAKVHRRLLLSGIKEVELRFMDQNSRWQTRWPDARSGKPVPLPRAIEIKLTLEPWGEITRLFEVPG